MKTAPPAFLVEAWTEARKFTPRAVGEVLFLWARNPDAWWFALGMTGWLVATAFGIRMLS
jgi:hypothetical protein